MTNIIIDMYDGLVEGVYANSPEEFKIEITDKDDIYDPDRVEDRKRLEYRIKHGGLVDIMNVQPELSKLSEDDLPWPDSNVLILVRDDCMAKSPEGKLMQHLDAVYLDGYLNGFSRLERYITELYRKKDPNASVIYHTLKPLIEQYNQVYNGLCNRLNTEDYDALAEAK